MKLVYYSNNYMYLACIFIVFCNVHVYIKGDSGEARSI